MSLCRRAEQLVLYARALDLLSAALDMGRDEINAGRLQPSNAVRTSKSLTYGPLFFCEAVKSVQSLMHPHSVNIS